MTATTLPAQPTALSAPFASWKVLANWKTAALASFACWVLFIGAHHEPWFDEAQAWLLARDNDFWPLMAQRVRYEGTPGLWHAVLWVAIRGGLTYSHLYLLPAVFAVAGAGVVLWRAPFPPFLRLALIASYFFGYQFSVVARSYCLDLLLIPLLATFFASRVDKPLRYALVMGLIANANAHGFLAAGVLGLEFAWRLWESGKWRTSPGTGGLLIAGALGLVALAVAKQPADNAFLHPEWRGVPIMTFVIYMGNAFVDRLAVWSSAQITGIGLLFGFGITMILQRPIVGFLAKGKNRLLTLALVGVQIGFSVFVYASPWHAGLLFLFWIFLLWIHWDVVVAKKLRRDVTVAMSIIFLLQASETAVAGIWDVNNVYSPGEAVAAAITRYRVAHPDARVAALGYKAFDIQPWVPENAFVNYHDGAAKPSYILWDRKERWSTRVNPHVWRDVVATRPDLIVASPLDPRKGTLNLTPWACHTGFGGQTKFHGIMTWRGALYENETLYLFERAAKGCAVQGRSPVPPVRGATNPVQPVK